MPKLCQTRRTDGALIWLNWDGQSADRAEDDTGPITGVLQDVSAFMSAFLQLWDERKHIERRACLAELASEAGGVGAWRIVPGDGSAWFSDTWAKCLDYEPSELTPSLSTFFDLVHPSDRERVKVDYTEALSSDDGKFASDFRMRRKDGSHVWTSLYGRVVEDLDQYGGKALVGSQHDIGAKMETRLKKNSPLKRRASPPPG